jgi:hypothetical protein
MPHMPRVRYLHPLKTIDLYKVLHHGIQSKVVKDSMVKRACGGLQEKEKNRETAQELY